MKSFLAKHWLLIVLPLAVIAIAAAIILSTSDPDPAATFNYGM